MKELLNAPSVDITIKTPSGKTAEQLARLVQKVLKSRLIISVFRYKNHKNILALLHGTSKYMQAEMAVRNIQTGGGPVSMPECPVNACQIVQDK